MLIDYRPGRSFCVSSTAEDGIVPMSELHVHSINELVIVTSGSSVIMTETTMSRAEGHYAIFYPAGMAHQQINSLSEPYFRYRINFDAAFLIDILPADKLPKNFFVSNLCGRVCDEVQTLIKLLYAAQNDPPSDTLELRRKYLLAAILTLLSEHTEAAKTDGERRRLIDDKRIHDICVYINLHFMEKISFTMLADRFFMSRASLARIFRAKLGMTVNEYILNVRLLAAKKMLADNHSVAETADSCGFSSDSYFIQLFRRETGQTPADYRSNFVQGTHKGKFALDAQPGMCYNNSENEKIGASQ